MAVRVAGGGRRKTGSPGPGRLWDARGLRSGAREHERLWGRRRAARALGVGGRAALPVPDGQGGGPDLDTITGPLRAA